MKVTPLELNLHKYILQIWNSDYKRYYNKVTSKLVVLSAGSHHETTNKRIDKLYRVSLNSYILFRKFY